MALTKQDKKDIGEIVTQAVDRAVGPAIDRAISPLTGAIQADFLRMDEQLTKTHQQLSDLNNKMDALELEILDIKKKLNNIVYRHEFELIKDRLAAVEETLGKTRKK